MENKKFKKSSNKNVTSAPMPVKIGRGSSKRMAPEKPKDFGKTFNRLIGYFKGYIPHLILVVVLVLVGTVASVLAPEILGRITTELFNGTKTGIFDWAKILYIIITLLVSYIISQVFRILYNLMMSKINSRIIYKLRKEVNEKINTLPLGYFDTRTFGEVISRVTNDVETISSALQNGFVDLVQAVALILGIGTMMFVVNVYLALIALAIIPLTLISSLVVMKRSQKHFVAQQKYLGDLNGHIEEMYSGSTVIKAYNYEDKSKQDFSEINAKLRYASEKGDFLSGLLMPIMNFLGNLGYVAIVVVGSVFAINGSIQIGQIQSFIQYMRRFTQPIGTISNAGSHIQSAVAAAERVFELLDEKEEPVDGTLFVSDVDLKGKVEFRNVNFGYNEDNILMKNLSVSVESGSTVAIVGHTGAGKTTLVNLLMRFYDINSGQILIDDVDIKEFRREELRDIFGLVLQDTWLFSGSIYDNIAYGKLDATKQDVYNATQIANCDHFVNTLSDGYNTMINEEADNVSVGQKQLFTIARAVISDPTILILDEATSSVDTRTEMQIQSAVKNLQKDRTSFIIAHRLSTIKDADVIWLMEEGDVVEIGSHDELLKQKGKYFSLYNSQFEKSEVLN